MPISLFDKLRFRFNNGRGITGDQIVLDRTLEGEVDGPLKISDSFKTQQREGFSSRYHTGDYRYDRAFFSDEFYSGEEEELAGVETWNSILQVITSSGRVGRLDINGGPFQMPGLADGERVIDIARHGNFAFVGTSANLRVYSVVDHNAVPFTLEHTYAITGTILAVCAPNDHSDRMYVVTVSAADAVFTHYTVNDVTGAVSTGHSTTLTVAQLNAALSINEQSLVNTSQIKAVSVFDTNLWVYTQRSRDIKIIQVIDNEATTAFSETPVPDVSGGSGSGATISAITVNQAGAITSVTWSDGGTAYSPGDEITFTQGDVVATYTLLAADVTGGVLQDLSGKTIGGASFVVSTDGDHEAGRLQDIVSATRNADEEIVASSYVVNLFTRAEDFRYGNYTDTDTMEGSLFSRSSPLAVKAPWAGVNPSDLASILVAANVSRPVFYQGEVWYVDPHPESAHDAVVVFAEPTDADFPAGYRWRGSHWGSLANAIPNRQTNDVAYSLDLGRLERWANGQWRSFDYNRFLGPGPALNESHARVRVVASSATDKVGLLVSWDGHGLQRVSAYTPPQAASVTYDLHLAGRGTDGRLWLAVNPTDAELVALLVEANIGEPVWHNNRSYSVQHVHHDAVDAVVTFEDVPADAVTGYRYRGTITGQTPAQAISNPVRDDWVYRADEGRLYHYQGSYWRTWYLNIFLGRASDEDDAKARVDNSREPTKTNLLVAWVGSELRKVASYTAGTDETNAIDLVEEGLTADAVRHLIGENRILILPESNGELRAGAAADWDAATATSRVLGWAHDTIWEVSRRLITGHNVSATFTHIPDGTEFTATPVPTVSGGSGSGAVVSAITVDDEGAITSVTWANGGVGYAVGDRIRFTQGDTIRAYTLLAGEVVGGVIQDLTGKFLRGGYVIGGLRWRGVHWQDYLVHAPVDGDLYFRRGTEKWRMRSSGSWADLPNDHDLFTDHNVLRVLYDSQADALAHVSENGQYVIYLDMASRWPMLNVVSDLVSVTTHYEYPWVDVIQARIDSVITAVERGILEEAANRVPVNPILTLNERQTNVQEWRRGDGLPAGFHSSSAVPLASVGYFENDYTPQMIDGVNVQGKAIIEITEGAGAEKWDGAKILWQIGDDEREYTLTPLNHLSPVQRYVSTEVLHDRGTMAGFNIQTLDPVVSKYAALWDTSTWLWNEKENAR